MAIVLCDVDGVCADLGTAWLNLYNKDYNDNLTNADIKSWYTHQYVRPECGTKIYDYLDRPDLYDDVIPLGAANWGVEYLRQSGHRVVFVTTGIHVAKIKWLADWGFLTGKTDYGSYLYHPDVVIAKDKSLIKGDFMIDDRPENLNGHINSILFDQPWNREDNNYPRAFGWSDVLDLIVGDK